MINEIVKLMVEDEKVSKDIEASIRIMLRNTITELCEMDIAHTLSRKIEAEAMERLEPMIEELVKGEAEHIHNLAKSRQ